MQKIFLFQCYFSVIHEIIGYGNELFMQNRFKTIQSNEHSCCKNNETSFPQKCFVGNLIHNFGKNII